MQKHIICCFYEYKVIYTNYVINKYTKETLYNVSQLTFDVTNVGLVFLSLIERKLFNWILNRCYGNTKIIITAHRISGGFACTNTLDILFDTETATFALLTIVSRGETKPFAFIA